MAGEGMVSGMEPGKKMLSSGLAPAARPANAPCHGGGYAAKLRLPLFLELFKEWRILCIRAPSMPESTCRLPGGEGTRRPTRTSRKCFP